MTEDVHQSLSEMRQIYRWFGGILAAKNAISSLDCPSIYIIPTLFMRLALALYEVSVAMLCITHRSPSSCMKKSCMVYMKYLVNVCTWSAKFYLPLTDINAAVLLDVVSKCSATLRIQILTNTPILLI